MNRVKSVGFYIKGFVNILIFSLIVCSCRNEDKYFEKEAKVKIVNLVLDTTYRVIPITSKQLPYYKVFSTNKNGLYCGYNNKRQTLDLFSITKAKFLKSITLSVPNQLPIRDITSVRLINENLVYLLTRNHITALDSNGRILKSIIINNSGNFFETNYLMEVDSRRNFTYNELDGKIYVTTYNPLISSDSKRQYYLPFIACFDPNIPKEIKHLPIYYSQIFKEQNFGYLSVPQFNFESGGQNILYNFPNEPNIYLYNISSGKSETFGGKPTTQDIKGHTIAPSLNDDEVKNPDKKFSHLLKSAYYFPVISSIDNTLKYRIYYTPKMSSTNAVYNDINKNNRYVSVFDKKFNIIGTISLNDQSYSLFGQFVNNEGFFLPCKSSQSQIRFKCFKFKIS